MNRKATVLLTGTLTVSMLLGVAATANASGVISAINPDTSVSRSAASRIQAPTGTWFTVDGETIEDFDPPTDGTIPTRITRIPRPTPCTAAAWRYTTFPKGGPWTAICASTG